MRYPITPVAKPRMTQRDKWQERPIVLAYRAFKDEVRIRHVDVPLAGYCVTFVMPMPKSWSKKKRFEMDGSPHQQTPDIDNLLKGLLDACFANDCQVWDVRVRKVWGEEGAIVIDSAR